MECSTQFASHLRVFQRARALILILIDDASPRPRPGWRGAVSEVTNEMSASERVPRQALAARRHVPPPRDDDDDAGPSHIYARKTKKTRHHAPREWIKGKIGLAWPLVWYQTRGRLACEMLMLMTLYYAAAVVRYITQYIARHNLSLSLTRHKTQRRRLNRVERENVHRFDLCAALETLRVEICGWRLCERLIRP